MRTRSCRPVLIQSLHRQGVANAEGSSPGRAAVAAAGKDPVDRLHALARAYLGFIRTRPHLHDLAYGPVVAKGDHPLLQQAAITYWSLLHDAVEACQPRGTIEEAVLRRSAATWGTVYGIARLGAFHQIPQSVPSDVDGLVRTTLDTLVTGWQTEPPPLETPQHESTPHGPIR